MGYHIRVDPAGYEFEVDEGERVLESALRQGFPFPYSCAKGNCGTCKCKVLQGTVRYEEDAYKALGDEDRAAGMALMCQAIPTADLHLEAPDVSAIRGITVRSLAARVAALDLLCHDVMRVRLSPLGKKPFDFVAGQYVDVLLADQEVRSFSLANPPHQATPLELHIRRVPGGKFTTQVFESMKEKDVVRLKGPLGTFFLREDSDLPILLVAGGTGFAPIKGIVEHAIERGITRPMHLYWGVRAMRDLYHAELAQGWAAAHDHIEFVPVFSESSDGDPPGTQRGFVHEAVLAAHDDLSGYHVYAAGPPPMINALQASFPARGLDPAALFYDSFDFHWE